MALRGLKIGALLLDGALLSYLIMYAKIAKRLFKPMAPHECRHPTMLNLKSFLEVFRKRIAAGTSLGEPPLEEGRPLPAFARNRGAIATSVMLTEARSEELRDSLLERHATAVTVVWATRLGLALAYLGAAVMLTVPAMPTDLVGKDWVVVYLFAGILVTHLAHSVSHATMLQCREGLRLLRPLPGPELEQLKQEAARSRRSAAWLAQVLLQRRPVLELDANALQVLLAEPSPLHQPQSPVAYV